MKLKSDLKEYVQSLLLSESFFRVQMKIERYSGCEYVAESLTLVEPDVVCVHF